MYAGIVFAADVLGPVVAFICGGFLLELYTHFDTIDVSTSVTLHYITYYMTVLRWPK